MRRQALLIVAVALVAAPAAADARTIKVDWREQKALRGGGALTFHVTRIVATPQSWRVTITIGNTSGAPVTLAPAGQTLAFPSPNPIWHEGMALLELHRVVDANTGPNAHIEWWEHRATTSTPPFPRSIRAHGSWTGTFGGSAHLVRGHSYALGLGAFVSQAPAGGGAIVFWITDHSFTL